MPDHVVNVYSDEELRRKLEEELAKNPFPGDAPPEEPNPDAPREPRQ